MAIRAKLKWRIRASLDRSSSACILRYLPLGASILDVGCGNGSASRIKSIREDLRYCGIDITGYMISDANKALMDSYFLFRPEQFAAGILSIGRTFDAVLSNHNLEHCNEPMEVLESMTRAVKPGGHLYLAFPSEASVNLPSRTGCLNFHDDPSHQTVLDFDDLIDTLTSMEFQISRAVRRNHGTAGIGWLLGALLEPWSYLSGKVLPFTWYFWGFESVIVARRPEIPREPETAVGVPEALDLAPEFSAPCPSRAGD